jgi:hypothetical protein
MFMLGGVGEVTLSTWEMQIDVDQAQVCVSGESSPSFIIHGLIVRIHEVRRDILPGYRLSLTFLLSFDIIYITWNDKYGT